jgi:hypothetical protein
VTTTIIIHPGGNSLPVVLSTGCKPLFDPDQLQIRFNRIVEDWDYRGFNGGDAGGADRLREMSGSAK